MRRSNVSTHGVCVPCRKVLKISVMSWDLAAADCPKCPECGQPLENFGPKSKAPKRTDGHGWADVTKWRADLRHARAWRLHLDDGTWRGRWLLQKIKERTR